jgi:hypothetical protein
VFAGYTAYTDYEIGRVIQEVENLGKLDNTLIIYIKRLWASKFLLSLGTKSRAGKSDYNLITDMADEAIKYMAALHRVQLDRAVLADTGTRRSGCLRCCS